MFRNRKSSNEVMLYTLGVCLLILIFLTLATQPVLITQTGQLTYDKTIWPVREEIMMFIFFYLFAFFGYVFLVYVFHKKNRH